MDGVASLRAENRKPNAGRRGDAGGAHLCKELARKARCRTNERARGPRRRTRAGTGKARARARSVRREGDRGERIETEVEGGRW